MAVPLLLEPRVLWHLAPGPAGDTPKKSDNRDSGKSAFGVLRQEVGGEGAAHGRWQ